MPNCKDDDLLGRCIDRVVDEVGISASHELTHTLGGLLPADFGPQHEILERIKNRAANATRSTGIVGADIVGNVHEGLGRSPSAAEATWSKRRNACSTS